MNGRRPLVRLVWYDCGQVFVDVSARIAAGLVAALVDVLTTLALKKYSYEQIFSLYDRKDNSFP